MGYIKVISGTVTHPKAIINPAATAQLRLVDIRGDIITEVFRCTMF